VLCSAGFRFKAAVLACVCPIGGRVSFPGARKPTSDGWLARGRACSSKRAVLTRPVAALLLKKTHTRTARCGVFVRGGLWLRLTDIDPSVRTVGWALGKDS
jgi:hypothetical protein